MKNIELSPWLVDYLKQKQLKVLRDSKTHKALNVSYTEDGLKYTQDINRRWIYFVKAKQVITIEPGRETMRIDFKGNLAKNPNVYVEDFIPTLHGNIHLDRAELTWMGKAYRLCYNLQSNLNE